MFPYLALKINEMSFNFNNPVCLLTGAPIVIGTDSFICVVVVIYNLIDCRLYLHETFLTEKIPEIAASSLVRVGEAESPQSRGSVAKILMSFLKTK